MADWARTVNTTIRKYVRGFENECLRNRKVFALIQKRGRIKLNQSGDGIDWKAKYRRAQIEPNDGSQPVTIAQQNKWLTAYLDYRGYAISDAITKREKLKNKGTEAIVKVFSNMIPDLTEDMEDQLGDELYVDGSATGNEQRFHGIESFMGINGTVTVGGTTGAATTGSTVFADLFAYPSDTYAGLSTIPGNYGGSWTGSWPNGAGDPEYDYWSPTLVNFTSNSLSGSAKTWAAQGDEATRLGIIRSQRNKSKRGSVDVIILNGEMYRQLVSLLDVNERFMANGTELKELGFGDTFMYDGVEIGWEYGIPTTGGGVEAAGVGIGYGFNVDQLELMSLQDSLFAIDGPDYDIATRTDRVVVDLVGNLKFCSPRHFLKLGQYDSA